MVINDPKGELLLNFYVKATVRGYDVMQFNLMNAMKTMIYNPLGLAAMSAREGDFVKCGEYVNGIAAVFFPLDGGEDPLWPNAANNAFKRAAYGMIDFYLEEERELRRKASKEGWNTRLLEQRIDQLWAKVTLYNCYQLFTRLSSRKKKNPYTEFQARAKAGEFEHMDEDEFQRLQDRYEIISSIWNDQPESDMLTLYFSATKLLSTNGIRTLVNNADDSLKAIGGAEKMLSSCELFRSEKLRYALA